MANSKISALSTATTPLTGAELVPVVQGGVNKQTTTSDVLAVPATLLTASSAVATDASKKFVSVTNTGTGNNVLATSPTLVTPALGTPSSGVVTNLTGTASININGTVGATTPTTGAFTTVNATGAITSTATGYGFNSSGASTSFRGMLLGNTGATTVFGIEGSVGGSLVSGSPAYSTALVTFNTNPVLIGVNNAEKLRATTAGVAITGTLSSTGALTTPGGATFHTTSTALTNGAAAAAGTLLNAPAAGNPTKWIGINDNGTIRYIPAW